MVVGVGRLTAGVLFAQIGSAVPAVIPILKGSDNKNRWPGYHVLGHLVPFEDIVIYISDQKHFPNFFKYNIFDQLCLSILK